MYVMFSFYILALSQWVKHVVVYSSFCGRNCYPCSYAYNVIFWKKFPLVINVYIVLFLWAISKSVLIHSTCHMELSYVFVSSGCLRVYYCSYMFTQQHMRYRYTVTLLFNHDMLFCFLCFELLRNRRHSTLFPLTRSVRSADPFIIILCYFIRKCGNSYISV